MESSKSDGNKEKKPQDTKILVDNRTVVTITDTNVEREIQNILVTSEPEQNHPSCSWEDTGQHATQAEEKKTEASPAKDGSTSSISASIDVNCPPFRENLRKVQENKICSNEPTRREENPHGTDIVRSSSLVNLFDDVEVLEPVTVTLPKSPVTNLPNLQPPPVTNQPYAQSPVVTAQPRSQSPIHSRTPEVPPTTNRGIHVVNIPDDSINRSLQRAETTLVNIPNSFNNRALPRADQVLGPPPSYSKSLLDRRVNPCASIQFVAPIPPPSYDGMENELRYANTLGHTGGFTLGLGNTWQGQPQPAYCPVCETVIITQVDVRVSRIAHIVAMVMFLLLCWPFCLLPYFLNICNYTFHYCSVCHSYLGARRPFQRG